MSGLVLGVIYVGLMSVGVGEGLVGRGWGVMGVELEGGVEMGGLVLMRMGGGRMVWSVFRGGVMEGY